MTNTNGLPPARKASFPKALWIVALSAAAAFAAVYVTIGLPDNAQSPLAPAPSRPEVNSGAGGDMTAFVKKAPPEPLPAISFQTGDGKTVSLADWAGKVVLLNFWATWCAPCKEEMPSLDRLQKDLGSDKFEVVAVSLDRAGVEASKKFLIEVKAEHLKLYIDATAKQGFAVKIAGMPTTILIDKQGREIGRLAGSAAWDSPDAKRLITDALKE